MRKENVPLIPARSRRGGFPGAESFPTSPGPRASTLLHCCLCRWYRMRVSVCGRGCITYKIADAPQSLTKVPLDSNVLFWKSVVFLTRKEEPQRQPADS